MNSARQDAIDEGIGRTVLLYFGYAVGQLVGLGFERKAIEAQLEQCLLSLEGLTEAESQSLDDARDLVNSIVERGRDE